MYCVKCGAKLADTEKKCPLCGTVAFHPDLTRPDVPPLYPQEQFPAPPLNSKGAAVVVTLLLLIPFLITMLGDLHLNGKITWSGYVMGALGVFYLSLVLPMWFRKPNPVIFLPVGFAAVICYLLYIDLYTGGDWFLPFAFPVAGFFCILTTTVAALLRYLRRGRLYIFGGAIIAAGAFTPVIELLMHLTFQMEFIGWCIYPAVSMLILGGLLIFLAISRHSRDAVQRKFFI